MPEPADVTYLRAGDKRVDGLRAARRMRAPDFSVAGPAGSVTAVPETLTGTPGRDRRRAPPRARWARDGPAERVDGAARHDHDHDRADPTTATPSTTAATTRPRTARRPPQRRPPAPPAPRTAATGAAVAPRRPPRRPPPPAG